MLTYEHFVAVLLGSIERNGLNVAYTQELLDTHALSRSLTITCLPDGYSDTRGPQEPPLRATISFRWSPEFTVFSLRGNDAPPEIERMVDERLYQGQGGPALDVEVTYTIPLDSEQQRDIALLPALAHAIQELHASVAGNSAPIKVDAQLAYQSGRAPRVQSISARRLWSLDEALYEVELLSDTFDELCAEMDEMLESFADQYVPADDEADPTTAAEMLNQDRRYLKPPTA
ncbi:MAG: hypothetical protein MUD01_01215 [Chloroflexaceae bacterium]|nr:hypothetical protein [Chloroflexaceae bacterium]